MTTNKGKVGKNFYDSANVKNRNRAKGGSNNDKKEGQKRLEKVLKGSAKWIVE